VLDAAKQAADGVNRLIGYTRRRLLHVAQMRDSAQSISVNIARALLAARGPARPLEIAPGEAEETIQHLGTTLTRGASSRRILAASKSVSGDCENVAWRFCAADTGVAR
jgi:hypothetical protein